MRINFFDVCEIELDWKSITAVSVTGAIISIAHIIL